MHWLWVHAGLASGNSDWYLWWSGFFGNLAIFGGMIALIRKLNCHAKGCWRVGRQQVEGTTFVVCRKHHPSEKPTVERIHREWRERTHLYAGRRPGRG